MIEGVYENKCRKCNTVYEWYFGVLKDTKEFYMAMQDKTINPRCEHCKKCKKDTVHDVISYNHKEVE